MISLKKHIEPGSLRDIGSRPSGLAPSDLPIAGRSREAILAAMRREGFVIGRISADNAFVVHYEESVYYLFVRPEYTRYRTVASQRFGGIPPKHDIDHVHARKLADQYGYRYVLVALLPIKINRLHGVYEQIRQQLESIEDVPEVCFADIRIFDKMLRRDPKIRRALSGLHYAHSPRGSIDLGLTLKQRGLWNLTFGFDRPAPEGFVRRLKPIQKR